MASKVQRISPYGVRKKSYVVKGYSERVWDDAHAKKNTRQIMKKELRKELRENA